MLQQALVHAWQHRVCRGLVGQADTDGQHAGYVLYGGNVAWQVVDKGRHDDEQAEVTRFGYVGNACHMLGQRALQVLGAFVVDIHQQGRGLLPDKCSDDIVHACLLAAMGHGPPESLCQRVQGPQTGIVALCGDDGRGTQCCGNAGGQFVGTAHMA